MSTAKAMSAPFVPSSRWVDVRQAQPPGVRW
jgi:hypothetical protein